MARTLADIKEVDGWQGSVSGEQAYEPAFADRYGVSIEEAIPWARYLSMVWES